MNIYDENNNVIATFKNGLLVDINGKTHISITNDGNIIIERYVDTNECLKNKIAILSLQLNLYNNIEDAIAFLNFEDELFCS